MATLKLPRVIETLLFEVGEKVMKCTGDYTYPGIVVAAFHNTKGRARYVVEATGKDYRGMLHIFSLEQLARRYD